MEYVRFVAFKYMPDYEIDIDGNEFISGCHTGFDMWRAIRNDTVLLPFKRSDYDEYEDIQKTLLLIGLDKEKFWNAVRFIHYMWETKYYNCFPVFDSDRELLEQFLKLVEGDDTSLYYKTSNARVKQFDTRLKRLLINLVAKRLEEADSEDVSFNGSPIGIGEEHLMEDVGVSWQIYKEYETYHLLFEQFCNDKHLPKRVKGQSGSRNKDLLISRIVYLTGLTRNLSFKDSVNALHAIVKKCKTGQEPKTASSKYFF